MFTKRIVPAPRMKPTQVRIDLDVEKMVRRAMAKHGRTMQAEINRALRAFYQTAQSE